MEVASFVIRPRHHRYVPVYANIEVRHLGDIHLQGSCVASYPSNSWRQFRSCARLWLRRRTQLTDWVELLVSRAGMAKLADAADLKSAGPKGLWGFDSPSRHHGAYKKPPATRLPQRDQAWCISN